MTVTPVRTPPQACISLPASALPTPQKLGQNDDSDINRLVLETLRGMQDPARSQSSDSTDLMPNPNPSRYSVVLNYGAPNPQPDVSPSSVSCTPAAPNPSRDAVVLDYTSSPQHPQPNVSPAYRTPTLVISTSPTPNAPMDCQSAKQSRGIPRHDAICLAAEECLRMSFLLPDRMQVSAPKQE